MDFGRRRAVLAAVLQPQEPVRTERHADHRRGRGGGAAQRHPDREFADQSLQPGFGERRKGRTPGEVRERFGGADVAVEHRRATEGARRVEHGGGTLRPADVSQHRSELADSREGEPPRIRVESRVVVGTDQALACEIDQDCG